jgi:hypothetical protein
MRLGLGILLLTGALAGPELASADPSVPLDSGIEAMFFDQIVEPQAGGETWLILRYLAPEIGFDAGEKGYEDIAGDLDQLCNNYGLSAAEAAGGIDQVMITLMDRPVVRGDSDPEATMFMAAYRPTEGGCVWE